MSLQNVPINPGVYLDDTPSTAKGFFIDADKIRFVRGSPQSMGGWEMYSNTQLTGLCRGLYTFADNSGNRWGIAGTHTNLYTLCDGIVYDVTPIASRGQLTNPFTTTINLTTVNVAHTSHGRLGGDGVNFTNATAVGGLTISGTYTVTYVDANNYSITAASVATSSAGPGGGTVDYKYYLAVGLADGIAGLGYGTGSYSTGLYSQPTSGIYYPRTWSLDNWGPNFLACPRGGGIYEGAPISTTPELLTNGSFTGSSTGWTLTGWTYAANAVSTSITATNPVLTQSVTLNPRAYFEVEFTVSGYVTGSLAVALAGGTMLQSSITANGTYKLNCYGGNIGGLTSLTFTGTSLSATIDTVSVTQIINGNLVPNAPTQNTVMCVTPEKFCMVGGTIEAATGLFNAMHVRWSDIRDNKQWLPGSTVLSGFFTLSEGSRIVGMHVANGQTLIWTDTALYAAQYVADKNVVYNMQLIATGCGLFGPNAMAVMDGIAYWMAPNLVTLSYGGGVPQVVRSTMNKTTNDNLSFVQQDKIFAAPIQQFHDIIFLYPDMRDGNECSRYALLCAMESAPNYANEGGIGVWAPGTFDRTAWCDAGVFEFPIAVDSSGNIYYQEKGETANGGSINWALETGSMQIGNGDTLFMMTSYQPDFFALTGGCALTINSYYYSQSPAVAHGPFNLIGTTEKLDLMTDVPLGREITLSYSGTASPAAMRTAEIKMDVQDTGMQF